MSEKNEKLLRDVLGESADRVFEACESARKSMDEGMGFRKFLNDYCYSCGGDWNGMLLSGIKNAFPGVYEAIPDEIDDDSLTVFTVIMVILVITGIDMKK